MRNEKWKNKYGMQMSSIELKSIESAFLKVFKYLEWMLKGEEKKV